MNELAEAQRKAELARREASRAFDLAREQGDVSGALMHAHGEQRAALGLVKADVADLRFEFGERLDRHDRILREVRAGMTRTEIANGTRNRASYTEEALAEANLIDKKNRAAWSQVLISAAYGAGKVIAPVAITLGILLASQVQGCVPDLPIRAHGAP